jgi:hypothetical protein
VRRLPWRERQGLILRCGIVKAPNEYLLTDYVKHAYSEYKRDAARPCHRDTLVDTRIVIALSSAKHTDWTLEVSVQLFGGPEVMPYRNGSCFVVTERRAEALWRVCD